MDSDKQEVLKVEALLEEKLDSHNPVNVDTTSTSTKKADNNSDSKGGEAEKKVKENGSSSGNSTSSSKKRKSRSSSPKKSEKKRSSKERSEKDKKRSSREKDSRRSSRDRRSRDRHDRRSRDRHDRRSRDRHERRSRDRYERDRDRHDRDRDRHDRRSRDRHDRRSRERDDRRSRERDERRSKERRHSSSKDKKSPEERFDHISMSSPVREHLSTEERKKRQQERSSQGYKDASTIFVSQLPILATAREVADFFSKVGDIRDVRLIPAEKGSRKSRGFGYVEFDTPEQAMRAVNEMTNVKFNGRQLFIQSQVERLMTTTQKMSHVGKPRQFPNREPRHHEPHAAPPNPQAPNPQALPSKLYVGGLDITIGEEDIRETARPFGEIEKVEMHMDDAVKSKGYAFVVFVDPNSCMEAYHALKDQMIKNKRVSFGLARDAPHRNHSSQYHRNLSLVNEGNKPSSFNNLPNSFQQRAPYGDNDSTTLDKLDDDRGGVALNPRTRALLMTKLQRGNEFGNRDTTLNTDIPISQVQRQREVVVTSPCILLKNVFDPREESGPEWPKEIEEDVVSECKKYGDILHSHLDPNSEGLVYLRFESIEQARAAVKELNGRWFGKRQLVAEMYPYNQYAKKFLTQN